MVNDGSIMVNDVKWRQITENYRYVMVNWEKDNVYWCQQVSNKFTVTYIVGIGWFWFKKWKEMMLNDGIWCQMMENNGKWCQMMVNDGKWW